MEVFVNGKFLEEEEKHVSLADRGLLLGDGIFETVRVYRSVPFLLSDHLRRLRRGAEKLRIRKVPPENRIREWAVRLIQTNRIGEGVLRITLTRGDGGRGLAFDPQVRPNLLMTCAPLPKTREKRDRRGFAWATLSIRRNPTSPCSRLKTLNMLDSVLGRMEANGRGADEGLFLTPDGWVAEGCAANLFWVRKGILFTPSLGCGVLPGITRKIAIGLARGLGIEVRKGRYPVRSVYEAEEVFCTNSLIGIGPVSRLDKTGFNPDKRRVTKRLQTEYGKEVRKEVSTALGKGSRSGVRLP